ncbi:MAG TPA: rod-binding protein [Pararhizobium sp.]|nr:rod-binding protein [Pararhizobium sp.]
MSISPSSDLVLDVLRAANPASVSAARARLAAGEPAPTPAVAAADQSFAAQFNRAANTIPAKEHGSGQEVPAAYRKFEAMVLQSFIKEMLPKDSEDVYGKGVAGNIWKSMLAQHMATVISKRGGIGIADHILAKRFSGLGLEGPLQSRLSGADLNVSKGLVHQLQMDTLKSVLPVGADATQDNGAV